MENGARKEVTAPLSLIVSAFAPVADVRGTLTPQLRTDCGETVLVLIDLGAGQCRMGGSALAQVYGQLGNAVPDADAGRLAAFFGAVQRLNRAGKILAYHDRSDGGLFATVCEMMFAGHCGVHLDLGALQTLISLRKVRGDLPAFVINNRTPVYGFKNLEDMQTLIPELKTLATTSPEV